MAVSASDQLEELLVEIPQAARGTGPGPAPRPRARSRWYSSRQVREDALFLFFRHIPPEAAFGRTCFTRGFSKNPEAAHRPDLWAPRWTPWEAPRVGLRPLCRAGGPILVHGLPERLQGSAVEDADGVLRAPHQLAISLTSRSSKRRRRITSRWSAPRSTTGRRPPCSTSSVRDAAVEGEVWVKVSGDFGWRFLAPKWSAWSRMRFSAIRKTQARKARSSAPLEAIHALVDRDQGLLGHVAPVRPWPAGPSERRLFGPEHEPWAEVLQQLAAIGLLAVERAGESDAGSWLRVHGWDHSQRGASDPAY